MTNRKFRTLIAQHKDIIDVIVSYVDITCSVDLTKEGDFDDLKDAILDELLKKAPERTS